MTTRLPLTVLPKNYDLLFRVDFDKFIFTGIQKLLLTITESTHVIRLHCEDLALDNISLRAQNDEFKVTYSALDGELNINSSRVLQPGEYQLDLSFTGKLNDDLCGFYKSRYIDTDGKEAYLATTQLEAPYARKVFPCFDEPLFKATFTVTLDFPEHMTGVSNMPIDSENSENGRKTVRFAPTPLMSTYLLYMAAGNFDFIEQKRDGRTVRVYGVNGKSTQGAFALQFAADTLEFFEQYSGVRYPLPKLDLLAIPDFAAGAMENWGACTFREVLLYVDETTTSLATKKRVAEVIAHELWHQWSGNLVTMKWWDDLWLNEAFATYQAFRAVDHFYPLWHIWDDFIDGDTSGAFSMDMLSSTHAIAVPVHTANEIEEIFDHISYGKGGSVLRMIEGYIGEESFRKGVAVYLTKFAYQSAVAEDLWGTLEKNSGLPVRDLLISWVIKPGFPQVYATKKNSTIYLTQKRFTASKFVNFERWPIPLTWISQSGKCELLFDTPQCNIPASDSFTKINIGQTGFYRTLYDKRMYGELCDAVKTKQLSEYDRWGILNDLWACVFTGLAALDDLLEIMEWYNAEDQVFVLRELAAECTEITQHLRYSDHGKALFQRYRAPFANALASLGWVSRDKEEPHKTQLRATAINFLIHAGDNDVNQKAMSLARSYLENGDLDPNLRGACLRAISIDGTRELFDIVKKAHTQKVNTEEKNLLLSTLAEFTDRTLLIDYLNYAMTDAVRRQDLRTVFARVAHNPSCPELFFNWVKEHWQTLHELNKSHFVYMGLLDTMITTAPDKDSLNDIREFLARNGDGYEKTKANAFEKAELSIAFRERAGFTENP